MNPSQLVGARIRRIREGQKVSLRFLAERIDKAPSTVSAMETGDSAITLDSLTAIAEVLGVPMSYLVSAADPELGDLTGDGTVLCDPDVLEHSRMVIVNVSVQIGEMEAGDQLLFDCSNLNIDDGDVVLAMVRPSSVSSVEQTGLRVGIWNDGDLFPMTSGGPLFWMNEYEVLGRCIQYTTTSPRLPRPVSVYKSIE